MTRYVAYFGGASYAWPDTGDPRSLYRVDSLEAARDLMRCMAHGRGYSYDMTGEPMLDTPGYGEPGDWLRVAPLAGGTAYPNDVVAEYQFGPRGGITRVE